MEIDPRALTEDGYLKDQDYLKNFPYGRYPTSFNGCGWVAIYNAEHAAGRGIAVEAVYEAMRRILPYEGTHGTPFPTMVRYFKERRIPIARAVRNWCASCGSAVCRAAFSAISRAENRITLPLCASATRRPRAIAFSTRPTARKILSRPWNIFAESI